MLLKLSLEVLGCFGSQGQALCFFSLSPLQGLWMYFVTVTE
jgi:hypothetical protein